MEYAQFLVDFILHIDKHLDHLVITYGAWTYAVLFLIVFCETGIVVTPFLPGDSLLFAAGAIAARGSIDVHTLVLLLTAAAILGDAVNYSIGFHAGEGLIAKGWVKQEYLDRTHRFYEKYGGKTIIFARFVPIVRTFAPFLAGAGSMSYKQFASYNVIGGVLWAVLFTYAGYFFGEMEVVRKNFTLVIMAIIVISTIPALVEFFRIRRQSDTSAD